MRTIIKCIEMRNKVERLHRLFWRMRTGDKNANITLRIMFGKEIPITHTKNILLVLKEILQHWEEEE